jgi:heat-inducible transcriptional repressor
MNEELNEREKNILRSVIQQFILTATPVGSRNITKKYEIGLSPATVRNIMADLEESGFIDHPHTSAGRIPTDKGYRFYVDSLMDVQKVRNSEKAYINKGLDEVTEVDELFKIASGLLSRITKQLACVSYPNLDSAILEKIQLVSLTSSRILVVMSIKSGLVKTITLEIDSEVKSSQLDLVQSILNERLSSLTFSEIRASFSERFKDITDDETSIIRVFTDSVDKIFKDEKSIEQLYITGAKNIVKQPEFEDPEKFKGVIELIEDKNVIIHIFEKSGETIPNEVFISIGSENKDQKLKEYSFVTKEYKFGETSGTLGIVGPKRMEYSKVIAIVDYMAKMLSQFLTNTNIK